MRLPVSQGPLSLAALLVAASLSSSAVAQAANGPADDYPVTIGAPYTVDGKTFTPVDVLNYDAVGRALLGDGGGTAITGAHHTLPVPSYVEVTSLESGRTILVRLERRGPMAATNLIEISPGAAQQLGVAGKADVQVRVRRVNPPEIERAMLRSGGQVPARMDTPMSLVGVLKRKLDLPDGVTAAPPPQLAVPAVVPVLVVKPPAVAAAAPKPAPKPAPDKQPAAAPASVFVVQVAVFSKQANANSAAKKLGTQAAASGKLWRVRLGPFADKSAADAALAKARSAGYSDARIQRGG